MIATTAASYVVAIVFSTGRVMALSDTFPSEQACQTSYIYSFLQQKSKESEYKRPIICTNKPDLSL